MANDKQDRDRKKYEHILQYIDESCAARKSIIYWANRCKLAYQLEPEVRLYGKNDKKRKIPYSCESSLIVYDSVESIVSATLGGVERFNFAPYDPLLSVDEEIIDSLNEASQNFYHAEKLDSLHCAWIRNALLDGSSYYFLRYEKDINRPEVKLLPVQQMILDPIGNRLSKDRYIGHQQRESLDNLSDELLTGSREGVQLKTLNAAKVGVSQLIEQINLANDMSIIDRFGDGAYPDYGQDLRDSDPINWMICVLYQQALEDNLSRKALDPESEYHADEVECTYLYDMKDDMYYKIINRVYIVYAGKNPLQTTYKVKYTYMNPDTGVEEEKSTTHTCKLENPYVQLYDEKNYFETYPTSRFFKVLNKYDQLCDMESLYKDTISVMSPLTFLGSSTDNEKLARSVQLSGELIDGSPTDIAVMNKQHDIIPLLNAIAIQKEEMRRSVGAIDAFAATSMIGDRASAKEVVAMNSQINQRFNSFVANIETASAELGDKFLKLMIIFSDKLMYTKDGKTIEIDKKDIGGNYLVSARLKSSIKLDQSEQSRKALETLSFLIGAEGVNKPELIKTMVPVILQSILSRQEVEKIVEPNLPPPQPPTPEVQQPPINPNEVVTPEMLQQLGIDPNAILGQQQQPITPPDANGQPPPGFHVMPDGSLMSDSEMQGPAQAPPDLSALLQNIPQSAPPGLVEQGGINANDQSNQGYQINGQ